jgi:hypothetical protein
MAGSSRTAPRSNSICRHLGKLSPRLYISVSQLTGDLPLIGARASTPASRAARICSGECSSNATIMSFVCRFPSTDSRKSMIRLDARSVGLTPAAKLRASPTKCERSELSLSRSR